MKRLPTREVAKIWGCKHLPTPFDRACAEPTGEIWFEPPDELPELLAKYIFACDKLSIQLHPDDDQAEAAGLGRTGKEECWLVIAADGDARLGVGLREAVSEEELRVASLDGRIEDLLEWHRVEANDFFYIPAGTIHAIGAGVSLIEIQQNSDVTYRLYDYGRPRELHLDAALPIARRGPHPTALRRKIAATGEDWLVEGPHFHLLRYDGPLSGPARERLAGRRALVLPTTGMIGPVMPGECAWTHDAAALESGQGASGLIAVPYGAA
ncbi:class I mannose-6-phosphate isomerase [Alteriqipengyuania flavescens]|uniref:class I mannose-6-phosphate isomerase n=1 Tax=Alteriqipengyuania flavescens TaxID=3053610 RepID=UPI0025B3E48D|nr:class I mannose-6-phosphate isomerase [Alteriqipengyuania flavescens]WJY19941.1 class I mannose-6-phosphate isomerase [Alteriqipengyuania flavescens]WJY25885.1 class I mannose-6-phosphate isomerase [Alteriqipengyuania flavescens]